MNVARTHEVLKPRLLPHPEVGTITWWMVNNKVGECPAWNAQEQALYWIDVRAPQLLRLVPESGELTRWFLPEVVGTAALTDDGCVWLAFPHRLATLDLHTGLLKAVASVEVDRPDNRLNDGKVSPSGRWFVFGSMDDRASRAATGALYRASSAGEVHRLLDGLFVANGIAWSVDATQIFFSDSHTGQVHIAAWNETTGVMGTPRSLIRLDDAAGRPDGATVDAENHYWSAGVSAGVLHQFNSSGTLLRRVSLPCRAPTSCAFGGADHRTLYITSLVRPQWDRPSPLEGSLFSFPCESQGSNALFTMGK